jgi:alkanesulfonate monooxygenase SsuD/methylene tetrahydromethanopterin reductase-like flavin-dependent oxidoreductase (luciferase family)
MSLSVVANSTTDIALGTGVANVYSRSPALLGMSAATLDRLSGGRARLGLGVSSPTLVEEWHGLAYEQPLRRLRESIEIVRSITETGAVDYSGEIFDVGPYSTEFAQNEGSVPIYNAAMGPSNRRLTAEFADGWMPVMTPKSRLRELISEINSRATSMGREEPVVSPWTPVAVSEEPQHAEELVRGHIAQEMAMGYNRLADEFDYGRSVDTAHDLWHDGDRAAAARALDDQLVDDLAIYGTPEACAEDLRSMADIGVDSVVVWPPFTAEPADIDSLVGDLGPLVE